VVVLVFMGGLLLAGALRVAGAPAGVLSEGWAVRLSTPAGVSGGAARRFGRRCCRHIQVVLAVVLVSIVPPFMGSGPDGARTRTYDRAKIGCCLSHSWPGGLRPACHCHLEPHRVSPCRPWLLTARLCPLDDTRRCGWLPAGASSKLRTSTGVVPVQVLVAGWQHGVWLR